MGTTPTNGYSATALRLPPTGHRLRWGSSTGGGYSNAPPDGDYGNAPPDGDYGNVPPDGDYGNVPPDGDYADAPPPEGY